MEWIFNSAGFFKIRVLSSGIVCARAWWGTQGVEVGVARAEQQLHKQEEMNFIHELNPLSSHSFTTEIHARLIHRQPCTDDLISVTPVNDPHCCNCCIATFTIEHKSYGLFSA